MKTIPKITITNLKNNLKFIYFHTHNQLKWELNLIINLNENLIFFSVRVNGSHS